MTEDSLFEPWALLVFPPDLRAHLASLGKHLFASALERHGIEGVQPQVAAIAAGLELAAARLHAIGLEAQLTELDAREQRMCEHAGRLAPKVGEIARSLRVLAGTELDRR